MKKLLMALAVIVFTVASQAASLQWSAAGVGKDPKGATYDKVTCYLIDNSVISYTTAMENFKTGSSWLTDKTSGVIAKTGAIAVGSNNLRLSYTSGDTYTPGTSYTAYSVFISNQGGTDSYYFLTKVNSGGTDLGYTITSTATAQANLVYTFGSQSGISNTSWTAVGAATPEPTSGILMLLGMGLIGLRRRRA